MQRSRYQVTMYTFVMALRHAAGYSVGAGARKWFFTIAKDKQTRHLFAGLGVRSEFDAVSTACSRILNEFEEMKRRGEGAK